MDATAVDVNVRWMIRRDLVEVCWIEDRSFPEPWSEQDFAKCLRLRSVIGMVAESGGQVVGYMLYELNRRSVEILSCGVHPHYRRRGVGRKLIWSVKKRLTEKRRWVETTIEERNLDGQLWLKGCGFDCVEILTQFFGDDCDGYLFRFNNGWQYVGSDD
jgi:ribosomal-protein-alanine N-acetyltransferase